MYIGLGSNIESPKKQIINAITALGDLPDTRVIKKSGFYKSRPMGPEDQPDYINAVVEIETTLAADALLACCQNIEVQQGRIKNRHWGERSIDLDILLYADKQIKTSVLTVPHSGICQRDFVYMPLLQLDPDLEIPGVGALKKILEVALQSELPSEENSDFACEFAGDIDK